MEKFLIIEECMNLLNSWAGLSQIKKQKNSGSSRIKQISSLLILKVRQHKGNVWRCGTDIPFLVDKEVNMSKIKLDFDSL